MIANGEWANRLHGWAIEKSDLDKLMKSNGPKLLGLAVILGTCLGSVIRVSAASKEADVGRDMMSGYDAEQHAEAAARAKDGGWKPSCAEAGVIQVGDKKKPGALKNFCLNSEGNLLTSGQGS
jgi:hypothetical protein